MERNVRYEVLQNEDDDDTPAQPVAVSAPVTEEETTVQATDEPTTQSQPENVETNTNTGTSIPCPPPYSVATDLPSYEEAERTKQEEAARREREEAENPVRSQVSLLSRLLPESSSGTDADSQLGTDGMFLCTFLLAFVFNWIGLLGSLCITQTIAGRLGAMSGFGLSLVKWVAIVKHSTWASGITGGDSWLWWLLIIMGFLIFFRGCTQYVRIKYHWHRLNQNVRNNIFYYF